MRFYTDSISIVGEMEFEPGEKETLDSYRIIIEGLYDSGLLYTNEYSPNTIQHDVAYSLTNLVGGALQKVYDDRDELLVDNGDEALLSYGINHFGKDGYYYLNIEYTTSNGYTNVDRFALDINLLDENNFNGTIEVIPNEVEGFNKILICTPFGRPYYPGTDAQSMMQNFQQDNPNHSLSLLEHCARCCTFLCLS